MKLWQRIARLVGQSRIRLPRAPIMGPELRRGDWVQLGSERWRVTARRFEVDRVVFRLRPLHGSAGAVLVAPRNGLSNWTLEHGGNENSRTRLRNAT